MALNLNISVDQSPVPAALDAFYDFVIGLSPPGPDDKIAVLGTAINFDITEKSPLYNEFVVRAFADRTVKVSPVPGQAAGDIADRYSTRYSGMLSNLVFALDATMSEEQQARMERHRAAIRAISSDRDKYLDDIDAAWITQMARLGIDPTRIDSDEAMRQRYVDERVKFLTTRRYAQRIWGVDGFNTQIRQREITIGAIRQEAYPDEDYAELYRQYESVIDDLVIRPRQPELEIVRHWDAISIQDPTNHALGAVLDIAPHVSSIVDPRTVIHGGARGFTVKASDTVTRAHDSAWNVSGSASYFSFVRGSVSSSNESHFRSSISKIRQVKVDFENYGELQLMRDRWFSSTVLSDNKRVTDYLKKNPTLAAKFVNLTTGLIVGRGLSIELTFTDVRDVQEWGSSSTSAGGGVNICGFQLGGSGGGSSSYNNHEINTVNKTVTFRDDKSMCRLIGLRTTSLKVGATRQIDVVDNSRPIWDMPEVQRAALEMIANAQIPDNGQIEKNP